jgi:hypothetical protein
MGPVSEFFIDDHVGLNALVRRAVAVPGRLDPAAYGIFRAELFRHMALEERLLPATQKGRTGLPPPLVRQLLIEHRAIHSLLLAPPTPELVTELVSILFPHGQAEEAPGGLYQICDELLACEAAELVREFADLPPVKIQPSRDGPAVCRRAAEALSAAARSLGAE